MLPQVDAQYRMHLCAARGKGSMRGEARKHVLWLRVLVPEHRVVVLPESLRRYSRPHTVGDIHVSLLMPPVGFGVGGAGVVGAEDGEGALFIALGFLHEPDEAWAEHAQGRAEECLAEGVDGIETFFDGFGDVEGHGDGGWYFFGTRACGGLEAAEEHVVVVGHAGEVEEVGGLCIAAGYLGEF